MLFSLERGKSYDRDWPDGPIFLGNYCGTETGEMRLQLAAHMKAMSIIEIFDGKSVLPTVDGICELGGFQVIPKNRPVRNGALLLRMKRGKEQFAVMVNAEISGIARDTAVLQAIAEGFFSDRNIADQPQFAGNLRNHICRRCGKGLIGVFCEAFANEILAINSVEVIEVSSETTSDLAPVFASA